MRRGMGGCKAGQHSQAIFFFPCIPHCSAPGCHPGPDSAPAPQRAPAGRQAASRCGAAPQQLAARESATGAGLDKVQSSYVERQHGKQRQRIACFHSLRRPLFHKHSQARPGQARLTASSSTRTPPLGRGSASSGVLGRRPVSRSPSSRGQLLLPPQLLASEFMRGASIEPQLHALDLSSRRCSQRPIPATTRNRPHSLPRHATLIYDPVCDSSSSNARARSGAICPTLLLCRHVCDGQRMFRTSRGTL